MIDERRESQASLYVLGALPPGEATEFETALRSDPQLQLLVRELRGTTGAMVAAFPRVAPPPALKQRILAALDERESGAVLGPLGAGGAGGVLFWVPWALAACFAVLCIVLISFSKNLREQAMTLNQQSEQRAEEAGELARQLALLQAQNIQQSTNYQERLVTIERQALEQLRDLQRASSALTNQLVQDLVETGRQFRDLRQRALELEGEKQALQDAIIAGIGGGVIERLNNAKIAILRPTSDGTAGTLATAVWVAQDRRGVIVAENLPPLPPNQSYQLWLLDPKRAPVSGGLLPLTPASSIRAQFTPAANAAFENADRFAVSIEPKNGSLAPTGKIVLVSN